MDTITDEQFEAFRALIHVQTGIALNDSKRCLLCTRLGRRLRSLELTDYGDYYDYLLRLDVDGVELQEMVNAITTNKTEFFRERHHFEFLTKRAFPEIVRAAETGAPRRARIWCAASSLGHEPYSIAMTVREFAPFAVGWDVRVLASDIDTQVLRRAEEGIFADEETRGIDESLRRRYFHRGVGGQAGRVRAKPALRDLLTFRQINLVDDDWPIRAKVDVIFCRNVMIYFDAATQQRVVEHLTQYLRPGGYLLLGHSECICWRSALQPLGHTVFRLPRAGAIQAGAL